MPKEKVLVVDDDSAIRSLIEQGGFQIELLETGYLAQFPKSSSYCWWGVAIRDLNSGSPS